MKIHSPIHKFSMLYHEQPGPIKGIQGCQGPQGTFPTFKYHMPLYSVLRTQPVASHPNPDGSMSYTLGITGDFNFEYYPKQLLALFNADLRLFHSDQYIVNEEGDTSGTVQTPFIATDRFSQSLAINWSDYATGRGINVDGSCYIQNGAYYINGFPDTRLGKVLSYSALGTSVMYSSLKYTTQDTLIIDSDANPKSVLTTNNIDDPISILFGTYQIGFVDGYYIDGTITFEKPFSNIPKVVASIQDTIILNSLSTKSLVVTQVTSTTFSFHLSSSDKDDFSQDASITYFASGKLL